MKQQFRTSTTARYNYLIIFMFKCFKASFKPRSHLVLRVPALHTLILGKYFNYFKMDLFSQWGDTAWPLRMGRGRMGLIMQRERERERYSITFVTQSDSLKGLGCYSLLYV